MLIDSNASQLQISRWIWR